MQGDLPLTPGGAGAGVPRKNPFLKAPEPTQRKSRRLAWLLLAVVLAGAAGAVTGTLAVFMGEIPLVSDLKAYQPSLATKLYDCRGQLITELFSEQRTLIGLDTIPASLLHAVIAIEDNNFYQHFGIQFSGMLRSLMVNWLHKSYLQGGSTITQQLARNMFLTHEKTIERKIKEIILAMQIEATYTKNEILEMYLNQIYFGNGAYGVESAARSYFGKHAKDLSLTECALLAGLPRSPNTYNPYRNPERATHRRNLVLTQMQRLGYITPVDDAAAKAEPIKLSAVDVSQAPYFVEYVRRQLEDRYGSNAIYKGGLKVYTTLDLNLQTMAQDSMNDGVAEALKIIPRLPFLPGHVSETLQCALVMLDVATGEVRAMIGGRNFQESKFNRACQAQRQPGSSFKPIIYAAAMAKGFTQADIIVDAPLVYKSGSGEIWKPENFSNSFKGPTTLRSALTHSRNVVTVKLLEKIGVKSAVDMAKRLGIVSILNPYLTLALGASEVNLLELTSAFSCFPNRGIRAEPASILRVEDSEGSLLEEHSPFKQEVLDEATSYIMTDMLANVVNSGTGYPVRGLGFAYPCGGKTGTTNDFGDAWFLGFTTDYVAGVWLGLDSHRSLGRGVTGGMVAAPIWAKLMLKAYADHAPKDFTRPDTVSMARFCRLSGLLANPECSKYAMEAAFALGTAPTKYCDLHTPGASKYNLNWSPDLAAANSASSSLAPADEDDHAVDSEKPQGPDPDAASGVTPSAQPASAQPASAQPAAPGAPKPLPAAPRVAPPML